MTPEQTAELAALKAALKQHIEEAEKATTGPWQVINVTPTKHNVCKISGSLITSVWRGHDGCASYRSAAKPDAAFIASARTMSPLACRIALEAIKALEDDYNSQEYGRDKLGEQRLLSILTIWKGGEA